MYLFKFLPTTFSGHLVQSVSYSAATRYLSIK